MLIRITNHCTMGCNHCMIDATPEGKHMDKKTFEDALQFNTKFDPYTLLITGGEPTDHPQFLEFIKIVKSYDKKILVIFVTSNGLFLFNEKYTEEITRLGIGFQITNDPTYYPKPIKKIFNDLFKYEDKLRIISPFGRALTNNIKISPIAPTCFNIRSICSKSSSFVQSIRFLREIQKICTPSINIDGSIVAGEAPSCYKIGTIYSSDEEILYNINNMKCGRCKAYKNLTGKYEDLWDEMEKN
jgi:hypothetical protein